MATDVFMIVYYQLDTQDLQTYEWRYMTGITFITFAPAVVFLFVETDAKGPMYGSVVVGCRDSPIVCSTTTLTLIRYGALSHPNGLCSASSSTTSPYGMSYIPLAHPD
jgi:hypothetical protein